MNEVTAFDFAEAGKEVLVDIDPFRNTVTLYFGRPVASVALTGPNAERLGGLLKGGAERCASVTYSARSEDLERKSHRVL